MLTKSCQKVAPKFLCENCHYSTSKKSSYTKHLLTAKHKQLTSVNKKLLEGCSDDCETIISCPTCDRSYSSRVGLWKHKQTCIPADTISNDNSSHNNSVKLYDPSNKDNIIMMLIQQNSDLIKEQSDIKEMILEMVKNGTTHINTMHSNNITTNSHNKAFNLNFFLNETCKNAMNITDFVDSIKLQLSDLIDVGELGYVEGISKIIVKNLNALDETERPIHCTDKKRETFYVKDEDKWEKEEEDMKKIKKMINKVVFKNEKLLPLFKERYPDYKDSESKNSDKYSKIVIEAMGGMGNNENEKEDKIIRNISKATVIKNK